MTNLDNLLSRLEMVKRTGQGRYQARCPAHDDRGPSLTIRELDDGRILLHDFAGCDVESVLSSVGLTFTDLFPEREIQHGKPERRPFPAADILGAIAFESTVVLCAASAVAAGEPLASVDRDRIALAAARINSALDAGGLSHA